MDDYGTPLPCMDCADLLAEIERLKHTFSTDDYRRVDDMARIQELETSLAEALAAMSSDGADAVGHNAVLRAEIERLEAKLAEAQAQLMAVQIQAEELESCHADKLAENEWLLKWENAGEQFLAERDDLRKTLDSLDNLLAALRRTKP